MSLPIYQNCHESIPDGISSANNIANVNTNSYKAKNVNFQELLVNNQTENQKLLFSEGFGDLAISTGVSSNVSGMDLSQRKFGRKCWRFSPGDFRRGLLQSQ